MYQECFIILIMMKIIIIQCDIQIYQQILKKANHLSDKKSFPINNFSFIYLHNLNSINSIMMNIQFFFNIPLFTINNIIFMILNFINLYLRIKHESLIFEEKLNIYHDWIYWIEIMKIYKWRIVNWRWFLVTGIICFFQDLLINLNIISSYNYLHHNKNNRIFLIYKFILDIIS